MAADYPFRRILGVELLPSLNQIAQQNVAQYHTESQKCSAIESVCADATTFALPEEALIIYMFNPFPESGLRRALANLENSLGANPRSIYVVYLNPQQETVLTETGRLKRITGTHQYSIFTAN
jgi:hypothetical protein